MFCTVESDFSAPEMTRNIVMRPANGSATVFHTNAAGAPDSAVGTSMSSPSAVRAFSGRSSGDGANVTIASRIGCMPRLVPAEAHNTGNTRPAAMPRFRPPASSSCVSVPASKNFSISASSASATISISASRALVAADDRSAGTSPSVALPLPSVANVHARMVTTSTIPLKFFSSPIGIWIGMTVRPNTPRSDSSDRSTLERSRSSRLSTISRGTPSSVAASHTFSVETSTPDTASTTTRAESATRSAARASLRKLAIPGVSMKLILCLFHSA
jgi:hypothetical protein